MILVVDLGVASGDIVLTIVVITSIVGSDENGWQFLEQAEASGMSGGSCVPGALPDDRHAVAATVGAVEGG
jgi:hypothetical protein